MRLDQRMLAYVSGAAFSELLKADIDQSGPTRHRSDIIESIVRGASVVHVGCIDHVPLLADKIRSGTWFHARLANVASRCVGIDINAEGVTKARSEFGIENVFCADIAADPAIRPLLDGTWDYMILGEVLEHIDNPVEFLASIVANYGARIGRIIITVPNAFRAGNLLAAFKNQEWINSDHRYWFTPYTLLKIVSRAGLAIETLELCHFSNSGGMKRRIKNVVLRRFPLLCEDMVAVARPTGAVHPHPSTTEVMTLKGS
jgi:2-polyprenyl-3-methyl-5-hydroxy-6-metoxy-1,4-benzoquinol methylase